MEVLVKQLKKEAESPELISKNSFKVKALEIGTKISKDGRLILCYKPGLSITIEDGFIGLVSQLEDASVKSLIPTITSQIIYPGVETEISVDFKTNTDSIPNIYEPNEFFCKIDIVPVPEVTIRFEELQEEEQKEEANETI